ncbi:hypothetical protein [Phytoactinopolyspora halotolerans]|uniref:Uncharacterized protein n=1 Tax=Phytoactinopolyspora halotolerans TaxID=1981512 RepID=A0A6L9S2J2_9ACTN|nr:hypothetical protein [Phytoactinopolyspora halotolerans]NED99292.1 hypothetical protein [Phytoactinopolyspora halotolerans]
MTHLRDAVDAIRGTLHDRAELAPSDLYDTLGELDELFRLLQAVAGRVRSRIESMAESPNLRVDEMGEAAAPEVLAREACTSLADAEMHAAEANRHVGDAWSKVGRLYVSDQFTRAVGTTPDRKQPTVRPSLEGVHAAKPHQPLRRRDASPDM